MIKLVRGTLTAVTKFRPERTRISMSERGSTCAPQMGPGGPEISIGDWLQSEDGPAQGTVWIVKKIEQQVESRTWTIQAEHAINLLRRRILPGEVKPEDMGGSTTGCTARQAAAYILSRQSDWVLGDCAFSDSHPYSFNGDDLFSALETVSNSLDGCVWEYDFSVYPFRLHLRQETNGVESEIRLSRNARTIRRTIDTQDTCTRFYPVGKENLKLPGVGYVSRNEGLYGVFEQTDTDESLDSVAKLTDWADSYLRRHAHPLVTLVVDGMELAQDTGESLDRFRIGRLCRVPLVEYGEAAVTERISKIDYPDAEGDPEKCIITIGGEIDDIAKIVSRMQKKSGGGGRASARNAEEDHAWIEDTTEHVYLVAEAMVGKDPSGAPVDWSRVSVLGVDGTGIHGRVTVAEGELVKQETRIDATETAITTEVTDRTNAAEGLQSQINQNAEAISLRVSKGNVATQLSVECGNVSVTGGNLTVDGMVTANSVQSAIAQIAALSVIGLNASGTIKSTTGMEAPDFNLTGGGALSNAVQQIFDGVADGGRVTFTYSHFAGQNGTFSFNIADTQYYQDGVAAVTIRSASWNSRDIQATLSNGRTILPAANLRVASGYPGYSANNAATMALISGEKKKGTVDVTLAFTDPSAGSVVCGTTMPVYVNAGAAYSAGYADAAETVYLDPATNQTPGYGRTVTVKAKYLDESGTAQDAASITVTTPADRAPTDAAVSSQKQGQTWYVNVTRADGESQLLEVNMASVYAKAREGYTQGIFSLATVTKQGTGVSIKEIGSEVYFKAVSITPISTGYAVTARTRYLRKTSGVNALTGYSNYNSGDSITLYKRSTNSYGDVTYSSAGYHVWRYGGSVQTLYEANGSVTDYDVGSDANGKTLYEAGTAVTRYEKVNAGGSGISTYYNAKTAKDYYQKGETVTNTYYTKA